MNQRHTVGADDVVRISETDMERLLEELGESPTGRRNRALVLLMSDSGLRCAEALALETRDVVRQADQITHVLVRRGKGGKPAKQPVSGRTAGALAIWIQERDRLGIQGDVVLCTVSEGRRRSRFAVGAGELVPGRALASAYVRSMVKQAGRQAQLEVDIHPHLLRHWAITRYLRANRDLELTRRFARHADITTTARIYAHLVQDDVDNGMAHLPGNGGSTGAGEHGSTGNGEQGNGGDAQVAALMEALKGLTPAQRAALRQALE